MIQSLLSTYAMSDLIKASSTQTIVLPKIDSKPPQFYAHIDLRANSISAISPTKVESTEEIACIALDYSFAKKFLVGEENITKWAPGHVNDSYVLVRKEDIFTQKMERLAKISMYEIVSEDTPYPDIKIEIGARPDAILIHYHGEQIKTWKSGVRIYFTSEGNPHYLKQSFYLSEKVLNDIQRNNNFPEWPNPIVFHIHEAHDVSVYTIRSNVKMAIIRHDTDNS